ncbi:pyocin knob domain-containing protein [Halomonas elongata]|uniref:pyocin knob domain-containing protein n=1 Tax=Halomonas elongata TaxID=2746 RepID=UPI0023AFD0F0|nr:pyocin knob domain-containing protein [Halomonas elongata]
MAYETVDQANQHTIETLEELERRARVLVNLLIGGIDVGQTGALGDLALLSTLSSADVGNPAVLRESMNFSGASLVEMRKYGVGGTVQPDYPLSDLDSNPNSIYSGVYRVTALVANRPGSGSGTVTVLQFDPNNTILVYREVQTGDEYIRSFSGNLGTWRSGWIASWGQSNTTVDSNGFIKEASPIFRLANLPSTSQGQGFSAAGAGMANVEAQGVTAEHVGTGVYEVSGSLGLAAEGWQIELPQEPGTGQHMIMAQTSWDADTNVLTVRTFNRQFDASTASIVPGDPADIPDGRWLDLRLEMPEPEDPEGPVEP